MDRYKTITFPKNPAKTFLAPVEIDELQARIAYTAGGVNQGVEQVERQLADAYRQRTSVVDLLSKTHGHRERPTLVARYQANEARIKKLELAQVLAYINES